MYVRACVRVCVRARGHLYVCACVDNILPHSHIINSQQQLNHTDSEFLKPVYEFFKCVTIFGDKSLYTEAVKNVLYTKMFVINSN